MAVVPAPPVEGQSLVVLDDEPNICSALQRLLRRDGYSIFTTTSPESALDYIGAHPVDVVISDQRMPECKGTDFLRAVQSLKPESVRIVLSGYSDLKDVAAAMTDGVINKFLTKPWDDGLLRADIREAFGRARNLRNLRNHAYFDASTGLATCAQLESIYPGLCDDVAEKGTTLCVFYFALPEFSELEHSYGEAAAGRVFRAVAGRVQEGLGPETELARRGSGFVAVSEALDPDSRLRVVRDSLRAVESRRFRVDSELEWKPRFNIGCAFNVANAESLSSLIERARVAARDAHEASTQRVRVFDPTMQESKRRALRLTADLRKAVEAAELIQYYQPQVDVRTGRVFGVEALVRWQHPAFGFVSPEDFLPLAESSGLTFALGELMLRQAVSAFTAWRTQGLSIEQIAVNVSPTQLASEKFVDLVSEVIGDAQMAPASLVLEVTENAAVGSGKAVTENLSNLKACGVTLAIDDFGTGHANLSNLAGLPVSKIKLDRSLLPMDVTDAQSVRIFRNVVGLINDLECDALAEGVETATQLGIAHAAGCHYIQGYFYSPPVVSTHIATILRDGLGTLAA